MSGNSRQRRALRRAIGQEELDARRMERSLTGTPHMPRKYRKQIAALSKALNAGSMPHINAAQFSNMDVKLDPMNPGAITITADVSLPTPVDYIAGTFTLEPQS